MQSATPMVPKWDLVIGHVYSKPMAPEAKQCLAEAVQQECDQGDTSACVC